MAYDFFGNRGKYPETSRPGTLAPEDPMLDFSKLSANVPQKFVPLKEYSDYLKCQYSPDWEGNSCAYVTTLK